MAESAHLIDLVAAHSVLFSLDIDLGDRATALIQALEIPESDIDRRLFLEQYERSKTRHELAVFFSEQRDVRISYDLRPTEGDLSHPPARDAIAALCNLGGEVQAYCYGDFEFPVSEYRSVPQLPVTMERSEALPFDEVRGYRLVKLAADREPVYSVVLDMIDTDIVSVHVSFAHAGTFDTPDFVAAAFARAIQISGQFVRIGAPAER